MKERLLDYLACPACRGDVAFKEEPLREGAEIMRGTLACACGMAFAVREGVPVMLMGGLSPIEGRTAESFGYEWEKFPELFPQYRHNFLEYVRPLTEPFFAGKTVLDAGSGNGRHAYFASRFGARDVIAMDIGRAAYVTARNTAQCGNVHAVQGDIMRPPFKKGIFDIALSIGVLHHLPDPEGGFRSIARLVRKGGTLAIWVYGRAHNISNVYVYEFLRIFTRMIPHPILYRLSYIPAACVQLMNLFRIPFFTYYRRFPFRTKVNDAFDVFSAPRSTYWRKHEIESWYANAGFASYAVSYLRKKGLKAFGKRE